MITKRLRIKGGSFLAGDEPVRLRGFGLGSWMNLEHFMIGLPCPESIIRETVRTVLGPEGEAQFFGLFLDSFFGEADAAFLESLGVNSLRVAFNYHYFIDDQRPDAALDEGFRHLDRVIDLCGRHGIWCILDLHAAPGGQNPDWHSDNRTGVSAFWNYRAFRDQAAALWGRIAAHYRGNPWVGGYDVLNEPFQVPDLPTLTGFYDDVLRSIRAADAEHIVFLEGRRFAMDFSGLGKPEDPQTAYTFHYYPSVWDPRVLSADLAPPVRSRLLREALEPMAEMGGRFGMPLWCGETGFVPEPGRTDFFRDLNREVLDLFEERGISWSLWSYKDAQVMGLLHPRSETPWMGLAREISGKWTHTREMADAKEALALMGGRFYDPLPEDLAYELQFRLRGLFHSIYARQVLAPALERIPHEELMRLPESFLFERCACRQEMADLISGYCR